MRVALFTDTFYPQVNGVARTLKRLTDHMQKRDIDCEIFVPEMEDGPSYPNVNQFSSLPFIFYPECRAAIANPSKITDRLRTFSPDLVHVTTPLTMGLYGAHAAKKLNIPLVASYHTHFDQYLDYYKLTWLNPLLWRYMKWFHQPCERIFVPSEETKSHLEAQGFHSLAVWARGVDCDLYTPKKKTTWLREQYQIKEKYIFLYVGRLAPEKDLKTLTAIMENISPELQKQVHWVIVGNGPSYSDLLQHTAERDNITLTGYLKGEKLAMTYAEADLFIFPSPTETFGNVVLEALASGTPGIVANEGGVKEIIEHDQTGYICQARDADSFIQSIEDIMLQSTKRVIMSQNARKYALAQSWDQILDDLLSEYEEVIQFKKNPMAKLA
ncbi:glycosyltransferase family 1 protein [Cytobacillus spongiae]|uniref:glycosyltransferase family 4 protein n=1 Tax=Cytobacillus spongiae TaxID=2901381 RepID=UPI001F1B1A30|nr:glycosyltransferase family 1 protein [Cytobacillus spongiae]UII55949.1 glycosyltransferase family 1 protein [Cytobacillus spongiae]